MSDDRWIVIPNWQKFQHYHDRNAPWIKAYTDLIHRAEYLELSPTSRALLHGCWLLYELSAGQMRAGSVPKALQIKTSARHWKELNDAGFVRFRASKPLALTRARPLAERRGEKKKNPPNLPQTREANGHSQLTKKDLRRYTGCRYTRGSHGSGYARDPLGVDKPPPDWPYDRPTRDELVAALEAKT